MTDFIDEIYFETKDTCKKNFPQLKNSIKVDTVIIGGNISGCITSYLLSLYNIENILIEENEIGFNSNASCGFFTHSCLPCDRNLGIGKVLCQKSQDDLEFLLSVIHQQSFLERSKVFCFDGTTLIEQGNTNCIINPLKLCNLLAKSAAIKGTYIYEKSKIREINFKETEIIILLEFSAIKCKHLIIASENIAAKLIANKINISTSFNRNYKTNLNPSEGTLIYKKDLNLFANIFMDGTLLFSSFDKDLIQDSYVYNIFQQLDLSINNVEAKHQWETISLNSTDKYSIIGKSDKLKNCYFNLPNGLTNCCDAILGAYAIKDLIKYNKSFLKV